VESKFGVGIGRIQWLHNEKEWSLTGVDGQNLGQFKGLVASDKNIVSPRITEVTGRLPLLGMSMMVFFPWLSLFFHVIPHSFYLLEETMLGSIDSSLV